MTVTNKVLTLYEQFVEGHLLAGIEEVTPETEAISHLVAELREAWKVIDKYATDTTEQRAIDDGRVARHYLKKVNANSEDPKMRIDKLAKTETTERFSKKPIIGSQALLWAYDRLEFTHSEDPDCLYMQRFKEVIEEVEKREAGRGHEMG